MRSLRPPPYAARRARRGHRFAVVSLFILGGLLCPPPLQAQESPGAIQPVDRGPGRAPPAPAGIAVLDPDEPATTASPGPIRAAFPFPIPADDDGDGPPVDVEADSLEHDTVTNTLTAEGNVRVSRGPTMSLAAQRVSFNLLSHEIEAAGDIQMRWREDLLSGQRLRLDPELYRGEMGQAVIDMGGPGGRASAEQVVLHDRNTLTLTDASFTNCDCEDPPWRLVSDRITIRRDENEASARNLTLYLHGVPIAFTPWWRQPVRPERKSGFLTPSFRISNSTGFATDIPYYWNIAPERDLTIALRPTSRRGVLGRFQYRYLGPDHEGQLEFLGIHDALDEQFRGLSVFSHEHHFDAWRLRVRLEKSQTRDFINDFEQELVEDSSAYLDSLVIVDRLWSRDRSFTGTEFGFLAYQDLQAETDRQTVQQLPFGLVVDSRPLKLTGGDWRLASEMRFDNFYQFAGNLTHRVDFAPGVQFSRPLHIGRLSGQMGLRETLYQVDGEPAQAVGQSDGFHHREASLFNVRLDGRIARVFDRSHLQGERYRAWKHTIEPTLQYTVNAVTNQSELPNYDSLPAATSTEPILRDFNATNLFSTNLYPGIDRVSGGHWISYGLTTRLLGRRVESEDVRELASFMIGQRWAPAGHQDFQDGHDISNIVAAIQFVASDRWSVSGNGRFDPHRNSVQTADVALTFANQRNDEFALGFNLNRQYDADTVKDISLDADIGLIDNWRWTQQAEYSLVNNGGKSWVTGLVYVHDCWSIEFNVGRRLSSDTGEHGGGFAGFFISFLGLGGYGVN